MEQLEGKRCKFAVAQEIKKNLVELRAFGKNLSGEEVVLDFLADFVRESEIVVHSKALEIGPDGRGSIFSAGVFVKAKEAFKGKKAIIIIVIFGEKIVHFFIVPLAHAGKASRSELVGLFLAHFTISRVAFKDYLEATDCLGIQLVVYQHLRFIVGVDVPFCEAEGVIQVDWEFLDGSRVVVVWDLPFLAEFNFLDF